MAPSVIAATRPSRAAPEPRHDHCPRGAVGGAGEPEQHKVRGEDAPERGEPVAVGRHDDEPEDVHLAQHQDRGGADEQERIGARPEAQRLHRQQQQDRADDEMDEPGEDEAEAAGPRILVAVAEHAAMHVAQGLAEFDAERERLEREADQDAEAEQVPQRAELELLRRLRGPRNGGPPRRRQRAG